MRPEKKQFGFTLMELLMVMGVVAILAVASLSVWKNNRNHMIFSQSKNDVILALEKARSRAEIGFQKDINSKCQGVNVNGSTLIISEKCGINCDTVCGNSDEIYLAASVVNSSDFPVNFKRITGETTETTEKTITVTYGGQTSRIKVKPDGAIYEVMP